MSGFFFSYIPLVLIPLFYILRNFRRKEYMLFSSIAFFPGEKKRVKINPLFLLAWLFLFLAASDLHFRKPAPYANTSGPLLFLLLDRSGSMEDKMEELKKEVKHLITSFENRASPPFVGLATFARTATILSPPTRDYKALLTLVDNIQVVKNPEEDGTAMGYALFKTAEVMQEMTQEKSAIFLVTDGFDKPNEKDAGNPRRSLRLVDAAEYLKEKKIRLYLFSIDPKIDSPDVSALRLFLEKVAKEAGGSFHGTSEKELEPLMSELASEYQGEGERGSVRTYSLYIPFTLLFLTLLFLLRRSW